MFGTLPSSNLQDVDSKARESDMHRKTTDGRRIMGLAVVVGLLFTSVITQADDPSSRKRTRQQSDRDEKASPLGPECLAVDRFFADEVWAKVGERTCLKCHNAKGDA